MLPRKVPVLMLMLCPKCQKSNPTGRPSCIRCTAPLRNAPRVPARGRARPVATLTVRRDESQSAPLALPEYLLADGQDAVLARQVYGRAYRLLVRYGQMGERIEYVAVGARKGPEGAFDGAVASNKPLIIYKQRGTSGHLRADEWLSG